MSKAKVSVHAKYRLNERFDIHKKQDSLKIFKIALQRGKSPADFNGPMQDFLKSKMRGGRQVKVYDDKVFIYSSRKILITSYELPDKYKQYMVKKKEECELKEEFNLLKNYKLRDTFIAEFDLFISLMQLSKGVGLLQDEETLREMDEKLMRLAIMLHVLEKRVRQVDTVKCDLEITEENCIEVSKQSLEDFKSVIVCIKGFRSGENQITTPYKKITKIILCLKKELEFFKKKGYFISDSVLNNKNK